MAGLLSSLTAIAGDFVQTATDIAFNKTELEKKLDEVRREGQSWGRERDPLPRAHSLSHARRPSLFPSPPSAPQALSKANWGASSTLLRDIAQATFHQ